MSKKYIIPVKKHIFLTVALPAGQSTREYRVKSGVTLSLLLTGTGSFDARVTVRLAGRGAAATITGIFTATADTKQKLHTMQIHEAPGTTSNLLVKTVLSGRAAFLYDGGIRIEKSAQTSDAYQRNENLLLSGTPHAESKPTLEILADDVRCTHGAASGPADPDGVWYLETKGMSKEQSTALIAQGFIQSALDRIPVAKRGIISL